MEKVDISFKTSASDPAVFNFRVACIIEKDGQVLLHRKKADDFWNMLGGRVQFGETCEEAIRRELKEEIGCECSYVKHEHICENFFELKGSLFHEILVIFRVKLKDEIDLGNIEEDIVIKWFPKEELDGVVIKPEFTKDVMFDENNKINWCVNDEIRKK